MRTESQCDICLSLTQEWSEFKAEVDDVGTLGTDPIKEIIRVVTRSQATDSKLCNWLSGYTYIDLEKLQKEDTDLKIVHSCFDNQIKPDRDTAASFSPSVRLYWLNFDQLEKRHGVFFQKYLYKNDTIFYQMLIPKILRKEVLTTCHDTRYAAHFGVSKTLNKVKQDFHWYKMAEDVKLHVKCCSVCNRFKSLNKKIKSCLAEVFSWSSYGLSRY